MLAREVVSPRSACPERRQRAHLPVPKTPASNSPISITYKLIQNTRLQVYCFGHLQKTGGWGSYRFAISVAEEHAMRIVEGPHQVSSSLTKNCQLSTNDCLLSPFFPLHAQHPPRKSFPSPTYAKTGGYTPSKMSARRHSRFFPIYFALFLSFRTRHSSLATFSISERTTKGHFRSHTQAGPPPTGRSARKFLSPLPLQSNPMSCQAKAISAWRKPI